ncbi:hypothetical protein KL920_003805 [Ogataea angusta]|nr:hypothetical protein KL920_003805 [Ogataea angusta]KAG7833056.1 hypothetical protein KL943_004504 [Ogataea angusta]
MSTQTAAFLGTKAQPASSSVHKVFNGQDTTAASVPSKEEIQLELLKLEKSLQQATSLHQLVRLLGQIDSKQQQLDYILHKFTNKRYVAHGSSIRALEISRVELSTTLSHSRSLKKIMDNASALSSKITERVRLLDSEKSKIKATKEYVENVRTLKYEVQKADAAIKQQDWLAAATSIDAVRNLPPGLINDEFVEFIVPTSDLPEMPSVLLDSWISELNNIFLSEFNEAAAKKDVQRLTYFFQLFPLIGKSDVGLSCYSRFICNIISDQSRTNLRSVQGKDVHSSFYAQVLFQLYQTIADIVHQHSRIITKYYGKGVLPKVLSAIQTECDLQSGLIFDTFWDAKNLDRAINDINNYGYPILVGSILRNIQTDEELQDDNVVVSLAEVSSLIDELSAMLNHWAMYCKFFVVSWNEAIDTSSKSDAVYPQPLLLSTFMEKIHKKITRSFDQLCTFAIRRTIEKAFLLENLPDITPQLQLCVRYLALATKTNASTNQSLLSLTPEDPPVTSMVEDITISLNLIMLQTITTGEFFTIKNMMSNTRRILENDFLNIMKKKLTDSQPRPNSVLLTPQAIQSLHTNSRTSLPINQKGGSSTLMTPRSGTPPIGGKDINSGNLFMKSATSALNAAMNLSGVETETSDKLQQFVIVLNSISVFQEYLDKLSNNLVAKLENDNLLIVDDQEFGQVRASMERDPNTDIQLRVDLNNGEGTEDSPSVRDRLKSVVMTLSTSFIEKSEVVLKENIKTIFNQNFRFKLSKMVSDVLKESDYLISSDILALSSTSEVMVNFIREWNSLIIPYLTIFTRANFQALLQLVVSNLASAMEQKIWSMERRCNELGAAKLEKDVSTIISEVTKYDYSLRDNFIRITQIVMMLGLDDDDEVDELSDLEWALTPAERSRARNLRIDRK